MYKKVLYKIKKMKKCGGEGEGQYLNPPIFGGGGDLGGVR